MSDQKVENLLELSIDTSEQEREKSENLSAGYNPADKKWEIIIRYSGGIEVIASLFEDGQVTPLFGGYAILKVTEEELRRLSEYPQVEYIEKPKALYFAAYNGKMASCVTPVQRAPYNLTGRGVLVGIIDSGIDISHPDFRNADGTTRIVGIWDQTGENGEPPDGYPMGTYYSEEEINRILENGEKLPAVDSSGHGTHVAGIAAGNGRASAGENRGLAYEADILVVKLRGRSRDGFPQTAELMMAVDFCVRTALGRSEPLALNLSYGNSYGSHNGTSLLETYLDNVAAIGRTTICIGSGNEGNKARHVSGTVRDGVDFLIEFAAAPGESNLSIQIWKNYVDRFTLVLYAPSGNSVILTENVAGTYRYVLDGTEILWYFGSPVPYQVDQEIYVEFIPDGTAAYIRSGIWKLRLIPEKIVEGSFSLWMPSGNSLNTDTGFLIPETEDTLTIPATAHKPIAVAAYNSNTDSYASFSGSGFVCCHLVKPDLAAPGVDILSCAPGGGYTVKSGTSMACPFVSGSAALLMQYGIVNRQDLFLYGEKVKAYLRRGARQLPGLAEYPNPKVGYGALCLRDSLP
jgi:subtilisin family serine protease